MSKIFKVTTVFPGGSSPNEVVHLDAKEAVELVIRREISCGASVDLSEGSLIVLKSVQPSSTRLTVLEGPEGKLQVVRDIISSLNESPR